MKSTSYHILVSACLTALLIVGCDSPTMTQDGQSSLHDSLKPELSKTVATVSYPFQFMTQKIAGDEIEVFLPAPEQVKSKEWQPSPADVARMQKADLIVSNGPGAPYADWLNRVALPVEKICECTDGLATSDFIMVKEHQIVHQHGPEGEHSHPFMVAHTWLDPNILAKQATSIAAELSKVYPDKKDLFTANLAELHSQLEQLSSEYEKVELNEAEILLLNPTLKFLTRAANIEADHLLWFDETENEKQIGILEQYVTKLREQSDKQIHLLVPTHSRVSVESVLTADLREELNLNIHSIETFDSAPEKGDYTVGMQVSLALLKLIQSQ